MRGFARYRQLAADEATMPAELEKPWATATPAFFELDGDQVTVVEARGDQEQRVEVCTALKRVVLNEIGTP